MFAAFDPQQIDSGIYFAAAALLIFIAAFLASRRIQKQLPPKWLAGVAAAALLALALIWLLVFVLNRKEPPAVTPAGDYPPATTGSP
jgi:hypothetical protein